MPKREIRCEHKLPISECKTCYPIFLRETTVGQALDDLQPMLNKTPSIKLSRSRLGFYRIRLYGRNGKLMLISETYYSKSNAKRAGINLHKQTGFPFFDMTTITKTIKVKRAEDK